MVGFSLSVHFIGVSLRNLQRSVHSQVVLPSNLDGAGEQRLDSCCLLNSCWSIYTVANINENKSAQPA